MDSITTILVTASPLLPRMNELGKDRLLLIA
jgi:hypothetical protein